MAGPSDAHLRFILRQRKSLPALSWKVRSLPSFEWSPDSALLAYRADEEFDGRYELYANVAAPPVANGAWKMNGFLTPSGDVIEFAWAPDES